MDNKWEMVAALGQVIGAIATFAAVLVSLHLARKARRPEARLKVGERLIIGPAINNMNVLMFSVTNTGERAIHVRTVGWTTGWFKFGPAWLRKKHAVQLTGGVPGTVDCPFELLPGAEASLYCLIENLKESCQKKADDPLFTRDYPLLGRKRTRVKALAFIAEGYTFYATPEKELIKSLTEAEQSAMQKLSAT